MLAYLAILVSSFAGLLGGAPWIIAATAIIVSWLSYVKHRDLYGRGAGAGLADLVTEVRLRSFANALIATGAAYGFGWLLRVTGGSG